MLTVSYQVTKAAAEEATLKKRLLDFVQSAVKYPAELPEAIGIYARARNKFRPALFLRKLILFFQHLLRRLQGGKSSVLHALDIPEWLTSVDNPADWAIIKVSSVTPTISLLNQNLRDRVLDTLDATAPSNDLLFPREVPAVILNAQFNTAVDDPSAAHTLGTNIVTYGCHGHPHQQVCGPL